MSFADIGKFEAPEKSAKFLQRLQSMSILKRRIRKPVTLSR
jgi:hypothetical protein